MGLSRAATKIIKLTPTVTAGAYSSGDVISTVQTVENAVLDQGGTGYLKSLVVLDKADQKKAMDFIFFEEAPASSIGADNAAYDIADADLDKILGRVSLVADDYVSATDNAEATKDVGGLPIRAVARSKNIYMAIVAREAVTFASTSDLIVKLGIMQD